MSICRRISLSNTFLMISFGISLLGVSCRKEAQVPVRPSLEENLPNLAPLGKSPNWDQLAVYAKTMEAREVQGLLEEIYCLPQAWAPHVSMEGEQLVVTRASAASNPEKFRLPLGNGGPPQPSTRYWRRIAEIPQSADPKKPLQGLRISLDPGHIGGNWAKIEERYFKPDTRQPVQEGSHTLMVAKLLAVELQGLGASVSLVRDKEEPVTSLRPTDFEEEARHELLRGGINPAEETLQTPRTHRLAWNAEKLFYRTAEIRERARLVNETLKPDLVVCLHFNADGFGPGFTPENHFHMILNGGFGQDEVQLDDQRFEMLQRLLGRVHESEIPLNAAVARGLAATTQLPAFTYRRGALPVANEPFLWARNLLANRLYQCPVAYCEPFLMNNEETYLRLIAGDYAGRRDFKGKPRRSIYREYAEGVALGIVEYSTGKKREQKGLSIDAVGFSEAEEK